MNYVVECSLFNKSICYVSFQLLCQREKGHHFNVLIHDYLSIALPNEICFYVRYDDNCKRYYLFCAHCDSYGNGFSFKLEGVVG